MPRPSERLARPRYSRYQQLSTQMSDFRQSLLVVWIANPLGLQVRGVLLRFVFAQEREELALPRAQGRHSRLQ